MAEATVRSNRNSSATRGYLLVDVELPLLGSQIVGNYQSTDTPAISREGRVGLEALIRIREAMQSLANPGATMRIQEGPHRRDRVQDRRAAMPLMRTWRSEDPSEQRETLEYLQAALDQDRLSSRRFFP